MIITSANRANVLPFHSRCFLLLLPLLDRISSTIRNKSSKSQDCFLVPDLRGKAFSLSPLNIMLSVGFAKMHFTRLRKFHFRQRKFLSYLNVAVVVLNHERESVQCFFCKR